VCLDVVICQILKMLSLCCAYLRNALFSKLLPEQLYDLSDHCE
jgi:hypothetical protein